MKLIPGTAMLALLSDPGSAAMAGMHSAMTGTENRIFFSMMFAPAMPTDVSEPVVDKPWQLIYDNRYYHLWFGCVMRRRQARSQATAVSLLTAAETVLRRRGFGKASLVDIAREAKVTTGAIYSSFSGKTDLLRALEVSVYGEVEAEAARILEEAPRELGAFSRAVVRSVAAVYKARRGGMRSLAIAARDDADLGARSAEVNRRIVAAFVAAVADRVGSGSKRLAQRAEIGFLVVTSALRDRLIFEVKWPLSQRASDEQLCDELAAMLAGYIGPTAARK
ncbi:MAG TPA: TetR/AcrR family transcriptional regulator [Steroidobacter sp.]